MLSMPPATMTLVAAREQQIVGQHRRFHSRAAHLVDGGAAGGERQAGAEARLARRRLALPGRQHAAHDDLLNVLGFEAGALDGRADRHCAKLRRREVLELALQPAHRRAGGTNYHDRIIHLSTWHRY